MARANDRGLDRGTDATTERDVHQDHEESMDDLAHRRDPSLSEQRRSRLLDQVRSRRTVRWVPAVELLRMASSRAVEPFIAPLHHVPSRRDVSPSRRQQDQRRSVALGTPRPLGPASPEGASRGAIGRR